MKIELTKEDLDYLALRIAENLRPTNIQQAEHCCPTKNKAMSQRLLNALRNLGLADYSISELSEVACSEWKRVRFIGPKSYAELTQIFAERGLSFGKKRLLYHKDTMKYTIL